MFRENNSFWFLIRYFALCVGGEIISGKKSLKNQGFINIWWGQELVGELL